MRPRSYLYVPGNAHDKLARAGQRGADALILDLEDAVAWADKDEARDTVRGVLANGTGAPQTWVRVNSTLLAQDIPAVISPQLTGIVMPKAETGLLTEADELLRAAEHARGIQPGTVKIIALIETSLGVLTAYPVACAARVIRLGIGEADLIGELGLRPGPGRPELAGSRTQVVLASAAAGLAPPIGPAETALGTGTGHAAIVASTQALLALGFRARTAVHPGQVAAINDVFTPSAAEVASARQMIATLADDGVAVDRHGRMIDAAVVRAAREILSRAASSADGTETQSPIISGSAV